MPPDVSVVVPFFNPGANIDDCITSLLAQTLPRERFEVILVDDGSTDGAPARVEACRAANPELIRVERIAASGWPGRPRNVGIGLAAGRYIQFVDADDALGPAALERLLSIADESDADIVIGKPSSDFRTLNQPIYRHTRTGLTIHDFPLIESLTPHKMFRRALLVDAGIRFAEGPRHVEDEHFCVQAYTRARSVAIVGDLSCYFYRRRRSAGRNLGDTIAVPEEYYRDLTAILDVIDTHVAEPAGRIELQRRFYRVEMLGRLRGRAMLGYDADYRRDVLREVRTLATTRFGPAVRDGLPFFVRTQSRLMLDGNEGALLTYARWLESLRVKATISTPNWVDGALHFDIDAAMYAGDDPLQLEPAGDGWAVPAAAAPAAEPADRLVTPADLAAVDIDCATVSRADSETWSTTGLRLEIDPAGELRVRGHVAIDPATVMGGQPLTSGLWDLRLRVMVGGLTRVAPLRPATTAAEALRPWSVAAWSGAGRTVSAYWTAPNPALALDVDEWAHPLHDLIEEQPKSGIRRRTLTIAVPAISGITNLAAETILEPADASGVVTSCPAELVVTASGSALMSKLPRRSTDCDHWRVWVRIGTPGGPPARSLAIELRRDKRRYVIA